MTVKTKITSTITRKLGPLPVWAWALSLLAGFLLWRRLAARPDVAGAEPLPSVRPQAPAGPVIPPAEGAGGGSGPGLPEMPSDLLAQLLTGQLATIDALTSALTSTPAAQAAPISQGAAPGASAPEGVAAAPVDPYLTDPVGAIRPGEGGAGPDGMPLPTPGTNPYTPAVQPPVDIYTSDNAMIKAATGGQNVKPGEVIAA